MRDVEAASRAIATGHGHHAFLVRASRLSEIENRNRIPSVACLYSLSVILNQSFLKVCTWCGLNLRTRIADHKATRRVLEPRKLLTLERRRRKEQQREEKRRLAEQRRLERARRKQSIVAWLRQGLTYTEMAGRMGVSKQCVQKWAARTAYGSGLLKSRRRKLERRNQHILRLLETGATFEYVARRLGLTRQRVHQVAQRAGYSQPKPAPPPSPSN